MELFRVGTLTIGWDPARELVVLEALAMSDEECEAVRRFVRGGGWVLADEAPAAMTAHCRLREKSGLADLALRRYEAALADFTRYDNAMSLMMQEMMKRQGAAGFTPPTR